MTNTADYTAQFDHAPAAHVDSDRLVNLSVTRTQARIIFNELREDSPIRGEFARAAGRRNLPIEANREVVTVLFPVTFSSEVMTAATAAVKTHTLSDKDMKGCNEICRAVLDGAIRSARAIRAEVRWAGSA